MPAKVRDALLSLCPGAQWAVYDNDYSTLIWYEDDDPPTFEEVSLEMERLDIEEARNAYRAERAIAYPPVGDQLDALFHAGVFPPEMEAQIQAVKDEYPKPSER